MPIGPRPADIPRIRTALKVYKVSSVITGTFLLLLCVMMVTRYGMGSDIYLGSAGLFLAAPRFEGEGLVNVSSLILIAHGWFYVLYLATDFVIWRLSRFSFGRFLFIALGGIVPLLSYFLERRVPRLVEGIIAGVEHADPAPTVETPA